MSRMTRATIGRWFVLVTVGACAYATPSLQGQEAEPAEVSNAVEDRAFNSPCGREIQFPGRALSRCLLTGGLESPEFAPGCHFSCWPR